MPICPDNAPHIELSFCNMPSAIMQLQEIIIPKVKMLIKYSSSASCIQCSFHEVKWMVGSHV